MAKRFTKTHEWAESIDQEIWVGISHHAQALLGDIVFIELPQVGQILQSGDAFGVIESVKAASDLYAPMTGIVLEINSSVLNDVALVNHSPENEAWLIKIKPSTPSEWDALLSEQDYLSRVSNE